MAPMDVLDRTQYLSLALFSQKVVSALVDYVDENKLGKLKPSLEEALDSLVQAKQPSVLPKSRVAAFTSYEQLRILEEVWSAKEREKAIKMIRAVLRSPDKPKTK